MHYHKRYTPLGGKCLVQHFLNLHEKSSVMQHTPFSSRHLPAVLLAAALAAASPTALAHGAHDPIYGGVTAEADHLSFELVASGDDALVYVMDHEDEQDATAFQGKLTVLRGRDKSEATLLPAGGNKMQAKGAALQSGDKVVAAISADKKTYTVRFVVK